MTTNTTKTTHEAEVPVRAMAQALARVVTARVARPFQVVAEPTEILAVYFDPPREDQSAADYEATVLAPVAEALAKALEPWIASAELDLVLGAAACAKATTNGLSVRVTESREWDERTNPTPNRVELRAEIGVA